MAADMDDARIERAAARLLAVRQGAPRLAAFSDDERPRSVDDALAIQRAVARLRGAAVHAWKVGAPPGAATTYAPMFATDVFETPASLSLARHPGMQIEGEVAFRLRRDLPASARPF